ncbi:hypothetical protein F4820DRAFT_406569 [Hypoxylon rubiginosum]|uniref:Uncharacterized protein n=1 Tax=Hypoxylon rubiginosum TaxID=110542 RepID=A0ACB9ZC42_9PEZI|nr:hypothetical protein F4820DRAFT_406569 [Hypoxylon rubiginosum]
MKQDLDTNIFLKHCFAALPIELRLIIWAYNLPGPRIVDIKCSTESASTSELQRDHTPTTCIFTASVPVNLHVCRESRFAAFRRYRLLFRDPTKYGQVIFDPTRDILYFGARFGIAASGTRFGTFLSLVQPEELAYVHRIAINDALISHGRSRTRTNSTSRLTIEHILCQVHHRFTNLERLTFVCDDRNPVYSSDAFFVEPRVRNRILERQIQDVVTIVEDRQTQTKLPPWDVRAIAAEPNPPEYDQEVLGYRGSRQSFFRRFQLPQLEKALANRYQWALKA